MARREGVTERANSKALSGVHHWNPLLSSFEVWCTKQFCVYLISYLHPVLLDVPAKRGFYFGISDAHMTQKCPFMYVDVFMTGFQLMALTCTNCNRLFNKVHGPRSVVLVRRCGCQMPRKINIFFRAREHCSRTLQE